MSKKAAKGIEVFLRVRPSKKPSTAMSKRLTFIKIPM